MSIARPIGALVVLAVLAATVSAQQPTTPAAPAAPQAPAAPAAPPAPPAPASQPTFDKPVAPPAFDVQVTKIDAVHAIVLPMKGSYMQHPDAFGKLTGYLSGHGIAPAGPPFGRYFSDPQVGEENLVWEIGFPVAATAKADAPFEVRDIPAGEYAVHVFKGRMEEIGNAWGSLVGWVVNNGYQPVMPAVQVYKGDMMTNPEVEMRIGVQK
jgi:effector-binding domain-containing protein